MTTPNNSSSAAGLVRDFVTSGDALGDRADLARFLRERNLVTDGAIPITLADFDEAVTLRDGIRAQLQRTAGDPVDTDAIARGQRVLDGLRVTVRMDPYDAGEEAETVTHLAPAVVEEVRRGLARIAAAWATVLATGEWRAIGA